MSRRISLLLLFLGILFLCAFPAFSEETAQNQEIAQETIQEPVGPGPGTALIKADQILYDPTHVTALGNVVLNYQETEVDCDQLVYTPDTGDITVAGPVTIQAIGEKITGTDLSYNLKQHQGQVKLVSGNTRNIYMEEQQIRQTLFYSAKTLELDGNVLNMKDCRATTCDYPPATQHYHITAEKIQVIPGDKMIISNGRLWIGNTPLWKVKKLVIDLRPELYHRQSYLPQVGYDKINGIFIKTTWNYLAYAGAIGNLLLDYYQKTGTGEGIEHQFPIGKKGSGHLNVYEQNGQGLRNFKRQEISTTEQYNFGNGLNANGGFHLSHLQIPPIVSPDTISTNAALSKQGQRYNWGLSENSSSTGGIAKSQTIQYQHTQNFGNDFQMNLQENFNQVTQLPQAQTNSTFHNLTGFSKHFQGWTANLFFEKTTANLFAGGFVDRTPEIGFKTDPLNFKNIDLPYQLSTSFGKVYESFQKIRATKWDFQISLPDHEIPLTSNSRIKTNSLYQQDFYDTGNFYLSRNTHARYVLGNQTQFSTTLANHFDAVLDYRSQSNIGFDPLVYDIVQPYNTVGGEFSFYNQDAWRLNFGTSYDFKNKFYQQFVTHVDVHPKERWFFHFDAYYDPNFHKWQNLITQADFRPLGDVRFQYWSSISLTNGQTGYQDMAVSKEWHDWEARLMYKWHSQQVFLFFNLKAFPEQQVELGIDPMENLDPNTSQYVIF